MNAGESCAWRGHSVRIVETRNPGTDEASLRISRRGYRFVTRNLAGFRTVAIAALPPARPDATLDDGGRGPAAPARCDPGDRNTMAVHQAPEARDPRASPSREEAASWLDEHG